MIDEVRVETVLRLLRSFGPTAPTALLAKLVGAEERDVAKLMLDLHRNGLVEEGQGGWALTERGQDALRPQFEVRPNFTKWRSGKARRAPAKVE
jgi:hypothetical protein